MHRTTAGESHGRALIAVVHGTPAGLVLSQEAIDADLARRQVGYGRGGRMAIEKDHAEVLSGVRGGKTLGSPITLMIQNKDWENWTEVMGAFTDVVGDPITRPRPGHADLPGALKIGTSDVRDVLERASARETAARVAAGTVARALLERFGVSVHSYVERIGSAAIEGLDVSSVDPASVEASDVRCPDKGVATAMRVAIDEARELGESLGGVFVVWAEGLVPGLGGYAEASDRLDGRLAGAVASIPAIKGVEFGDGFALAECPGSEAHDAMFPDDERIVKRSTNHAGGLEGGMTNGESLIVRAAMKPIPTLMRPLGTLDLSTGKPADAAKERSDVCAVPAAAVVAEAEVAMVLADAYTRKFGSDCMEDLIAAQDAYLTRIKR